MSNGSAPRVVLMVLDGWGYRPEREGNAIELASTPNWHRLWRSYPRTLLDASGLAVGLPEGQMGNSEVGHLNLGAGRVVPQDLVRISQSIQSGNFYNIEPLVQLCAGLRQTGGTLHLVGLLGPGGVHALDRHLLACVELGVRQKVPAIAIHGFLDGRDSAPTLGAEVVRTLLLDMRRIAGTKVDIATLTGACVVALGNIAIGVLGNNQALIQELKEAGEQSGERTWQLPLWDEYYDLIKSDVADVKNTGGRPGGTITAAAFLSKFIGKAVWAHLDIASTDWSDREKAYIPKGPTGVGARLLIQFLRNRARGRGGTYWRSAGRRDGVDRGAERALAAGAVA